MTAAIDSDLCGGCRWGSGIKSNHRMNNLALESNVAFSTSFANDSAVFHSSLIQPDWMAAIAAVLVAFAVCLVAYEKKVRH